MRRKIPSVSICADGDRVYKITIPSEPTLSYFPYRKSKRT